MLADEIQVLLVDDNEDDVSIISRLLSQFERAHFHVFSIRNTAGCVEMLQSKQVDLLILDYSMPGEDGLNFLRRAAAIIELPPVILITGQGDYRLAAEAIRSGAVDCLYKHTMTSESLGRSVQQALAKSQHEAELARFDPNILASFAKSSRRIERFAGMESLIDLSERLGVALGLGDHQLELLRHGVQLHDVGKIGLPRDLLEKPGPLTESEFDEVRFHPLIGERLTASLNLSREVRRIIRHHHERWDGEGYVDGLAGEQIPILARVVSVIDAYDAMITERPYRPALTVSEALDQLAVGAGSQWDPDVVRVFLAVMGGQELREAA
jgi:putative two-component system response regulator